MLQADHKFLERNYILYQAVAKPELSEFEIQRLHRHGIRGQRYFSKLPAWLLKWASLILEYIEYEQN